MSVVVLMQPDLFYVCRTDFDTLREPVRVVDNEIRI